MKKYSRFAFYLFAGDAGTRVLNFFANAYLARILDPSGFGVIYVGFSFLLYATLVGDSGLKTLGLLETAKPHDVRSVTVASLFYTKVVHAVLAFVVLYLFSFFVFRSPSLHTISILFLLNIFYDALFLDWYFTGLQRFGTVSAARLVATGVYVATLYLYVKVPDHAIRVPLLMFATNGIAIAILFALLSSTDFSFTFTYSLRKYADTIKQSVMLGVATMLNKVPVYLPPLVIARFHGEFDSGIFGAPMRIVLFMMTVDRVFSTIFLSSMPGMWYRDKEETRRNLQTILHMVIVSGFFLSLILSSTSDIAIKIIYGIKYQASVSVLRLLSWFVALTIINSVFVFGMVAIDQKKAYFRAVFPGFILSAVFIGIGTRFWGLYGAAVAVLLGECCFMILCYYSFKPFSALTFFVPFLKTVAASSGAFFSAYYLPFHWIVKSVGAGGVFIILVILFKVITREDIDLLKSQWNRQ